MEKQQDQPPPVLKNTSQIKTQPQQLLQNSQKNIKRSKAPSPQSSVKPNLSRLEDLEESGQKEDKKLDPQLMKALKLFAKNHKELEKATDPTKGQYVNHRRILSQDGRGNQSSQATIPAYTHERSGVPVPRGPKFFNELVERELQTYKKEVEEKFKNSYMNNSYQFPRKQQQLFCRTGPERSLERDSPSIQQPNQVSKVIRAGGGYVSEMGQLSEIRPIFDQSMLMGISSHREISYYDQSFPIKTQPAVANEDISSLNFNDGNLPTESQEGRVIFKENQAKLLAKSFINSPTDSVFYKGESQGFKDGKLGKQNTTADQRANKLQNSNLMTQNPAKNYTAARQSPTHFETKQDQPESSSQNRVFSNPKYAKNKPVQIQFNNKKITFISKNQPKRSDLVTPAETAATTAKAAKSSSTSAGRHIKAKSNGAAAKVGQFFKSAAQRSPRNESRLQNYNLDQEPSVIIHNDNNPIVFQQELMRKYTKSKPRLADTGKRVNGGKTQVNQILSDIFQTQDAPITNETLQPEFSNHTEHHKAQIQQLHPQLIYSTQQQYAGDKSTLYQSYINQPYQLQNFQPSQQNPAPSLQFSNYSSYRHQQQQQHLQKVQLGSNQLQQNQFQPHTYFTQGLPSPTLPHQQHRSVHNNFLSSVPSSAQGHLATNPGSTNQTNATINSLGGMNDIPKAMISRTQDYRRTAAAANQPLQGQGISTVAQGQNNSFNLGSGMVLNGGRGSKLASKNAVSGLRVNKKVRNQSHIEYGGGNLGNLSHLQMLQNFDEEGNVANSVNMSFQAGSLNNSFGQNIGAGNSHAAQKMNGPNKFLLRNLGVKSTRANPMKRQTPLNISNNYQQIAQQANYQGNQTTQPLSQHKFYHKQNFHQQNTGLRNNLIKAQQQQVQVDQRAMLPQAVGSNVNLAQGQGLNQATKSKMNLVSQHSSGQAGKKPMFHQLTSAGNSLRNSVVQSKNMPVTFKHQKIHSLNGNYLQNIDDSSPTYDNAGEGQPRTGSSQQSRRAANYTNFTNNGLLSQVQDQEVKQQNFFSNHGPPKQMIKDDQISNAIASGSGVVASGNGQYQTSQVKSSITHAQPAAAVPVAPVGHYNASIQARDIQQYALLVGNQKILPGQQLSSQQTVASAKHTLNKVNGQQFRDSLHQSDFGMSRDVQSRLDSNGSSSLAQL